MSHDSYTTHGKRRAACTIYVLKTSPSGGPLTRNYLKRKSARILKSGTFNTHVHLTAEGRLLRKHQSGRPLTRNYLKQKSARILKSDTFSTHVPLTAEGRLHSKHQSGGPLTRNYPKGRAARILTSYTLKHRIHTRILETSPSKSGKTLPMYGTCMAQGEPFHIRRLTVSGSSPGMLGAPPGPGTSPCGRRCARTCCARRDRHCDRAQSTSRRCCCWHPRQEAAARPSEGLQ